MKVYCVGGAVRDELLGRPVQDRDWVVVGATPEEMVAHGFLPVGRDFPVFLHPLTHEEYALARTERKSGHGYHGFTFFTAPTVTLEEDLARRDLTINAMARDEEGRLIDPFGGREDLARKILRHVSPAFAEDPVRILRLARFAARLPDFTIAPETLALARRLVESGEVDHLVPERVWQELARGLMEPKPSRMFEVLQSCGALDRLIPELSRLWGVPQRADFHPEIDTGVHTMMVIDMAARLDLSLAARFAALTHDLGKGVTPAEILPRHIGHEERSVQLIKPLCARLRVPAECRELALAVARYHGELHRVVELRPATRLAVLEGCDALRRPERFTHILAACEADWRGRLGHEDEPYVAGGLWQRILAAARAVDAASIVASVSDQRLIAERVRQARITAIAQVGP